MCHRLSALGRPYIKGSCTIFGLGSSVVLPLYLINKKVACHSPFFLASVLVLSGHCVDELMLVMSLQALPAFAPLTALWVGCFSAACQACLVNSS